MSLAIIKFVHLLGVTLFLGNIIVTAFWKIMADRTRDVAVIRFATRLVNFTDVVFTGGGIVLLLGAGHAMAASHGGVMGPAWILWSYILFLMTGLLWILVLLPVQFAQAKLLKRLGPLDAIPEHYWKLAALWAIAGTVAIILPLAAMYLMVVKPVA